MRTINRIPAAPLRLRPIASLIFFALCASISAEEIRAVPEPPQIPIKETGPGLFEIGKVRLNKSKATVTVPVVVNMSEGIVEYFLVASTGKTHESVFRTEAEPYHVHLAMLLLGARGKGTNDFPQDKTKPPPGDPVSVDVVWKSPGGRIHAEELILDRATRKKMQKVQWIYNGSQMTPEGFAAQQIGSIISMIDDPDALINNPLPRRDDDGNWQIRGNAVHKVGSPAEIIITLPKAQAKSR